MITFISIPATTVFGKTAITTIAKTTIGNDNIRSISLWIIKSILPPKYADVVPIIAPTVQPINADKKPIDKAVLAPYINLDNISLPNASAPSRWSQDGCPPPSAGEASKSTSSGWYGATSGEKIAAIDIINIKINPIKPSGCCLIKSQTVLLFGFAIFIVLMTDILS